MLECVHVSVYHEHMKSSILGKLRLRKGVILLATIALLLVILLVSNISKFKTIKDVELQDSASESINAR